MGTQAHLSQTPVAQFNHSLGGKDWCSSQGPLQLPQLHLSLHILSPANQDQSILGLQEATRPRVKSRALISWGLMHSHRQVTHWVQRGCASHQAAAFMSHGPGSPRNSGQRPSTNPFLAITCGQFCVEQVKVTIVDAAEQPTLSTSSHHRLPRLEAGLPASEGTCDASARVTRSLPGRMWLCVRECP